MLALLWILLPIAVLVGWLAAKKDNARHQRFLYYLSLRYLLNADEKIEMSEKLSELAPNDHDNAVMLSLTLGDVFRNKGEIDRAIALHEYMLKSAVTDEVERDKIAWSLALDFMAAGLLDRAEVILRDLINTAFHQQALRKLITLYEQQHDWLQALACFDRLEDKHEFHHEMAHLYCELAEQALTQDITQALYFAEQALTIFPNSARASLIQARIALENQQEETFYHALMAIQSQQIALVPLISPLVQYLHRHDPAKFLQWLEQVMNLYPHIQLVLDKTHYLIAHFSVAQGIAYLESYLAEYPNLQGLLGYHQLLQHLRPESLSSDKKENMIDIYTVIFNQTIDDYARYRCEHCGFVSKTLHWHCPSCQLWETSFPVMDVVGLKMPDGTQ